MELGLFYYPITEGVKELILSAKNIAGSFKNLGEETDISQYTIKNYYYGQAEKGRTDYLEKIFHYAITSIRHADNLRDIVMLQTENGKSEYKTGPKHKTPRVNITPEMKEFLYINRNIAGGFRKLSEEIDQPYQGIRHAIYDYRDYETKSLNKYIIEGTILYYNDQIKKIPRRISRLIKYSERISLNEIKINAQNKRENIGLPSAIIHMHKSLEARLGEEWKKDNSLMAYLSRVQAIGNSEADDLLYACLRLKDKTPSEKKKLAELVFGKNIFEAFELKKEYKKLLGNDPWTSLALSKENISKDMARDYLILEKRLGDEAVSETELSKLIGKDSVSKLVNTSLLKPLRKSQNNDMIVTYDLSITGRNELRNSYISNRIKSLNKLTAKKPDKDTIYFGCPENDFTATYLQAFETQFECPSHGKELVMLEKLEYYEALKAIELLETVKKNLEDII